MTSGQRLNEPSVNRLGRAGLLFLGSVALTHGQSVPMQDPPGSVPTVSQDPAQQPSAVGPPVSATPPVRPGAVSAGVPEESAENSDAELSATFIRDLTRLTHRAIEFSRLAQRMARTRPVREFAQRVLSDSAKPAEKLATLVPPPEIAAEIPPAEAELRRLRQTSAVNFDASFLELVIADQERSLELIETAKDELSGELRQMADEQAGRSRSILKHARQLHASLPRS